MQVLHLHPEWVLEIHISFKRLFWIANCLYICLEAEELNIHHLKEIIMVQGVFRFSQKIYDRVYGKSSQWLKTTAVFAKKPIINV